MLAIRLPKEIEDRLNALAKITGRTKHFINAFGEELIVNNAENALKTASKNTDSEIREYTAAPIYMSEKNTGGHQWLIEFSKKPKNMKQFSEILDNSLKKNNLVYGWQSR